MLIYYLKCNSLKLIWLDEIMSLDDSIDRIKNKNNQDWFKAHEVIHDNYNIYSEKEIKKRTWDNDWKWNK